MAKAIDYQKFYEETKARERRYAVRQQLLIKKAREAGLTVTDAEVDAEIARLAKK